MSEKHKKSEQKKKKKKKGSETVREKKGLFILLNWLVSLYAISLGKLTIWKKTYVLEIKLFFTILWLAVIFIFCWFPDKISLIEKIGKNGIFLLMLFFLTTFLFSMFFLYLHKSISIFINFILCFSFAFFCITAFYIWYNVIWVHATEARSEAFTGLTSALAFLGLIVTILVQVFQHRKNHDTKLRELRADFLTRKIDFLREKRTKLEDTYSNLELKEKSLMTPKELEEHVYELKSLSLKIEKFRYRTILLNKEFGKLIPPFASKKLERQKKRVKDLKDNRLPQLVNDKNISLEDYNKKQKTLFKKAIK